MKKYYLILFLSALFLSCNEDNDAIEDNHQVINYDQGNDVSRNFHGLILETNGNPVSNATVTIGSTSVQTNSNGLFSISNASVKEKFAHVKVVKPGFIDGSRVLVPTSGDNRINIMLIPNTPTATVTSGINSEVNLANGTKVKFDGAFKDANGNAYTGSVQVGLYHLKPSDTYLSETMPGSLLASNSNGDAKVLETFGMLHVELTGSGGQKLNIANGHTAEISLDIDASQLSSSPSTIPLWSFDEVAGIWKQEGAATKVGNKYVGNVSHFSWWNCDAPFDQCNLTVTVQNNNNLPISNLTVTLIRPSQAYGTNGLTNSTGQVTGIIPANETLTLNVSDFCGNVIYTASVGPFATGSSNTLPVINLTATAITTINITGILKTCANANVTNGIVKLKNLNVSNYYGQVIQTVTNGDFSFTTNVCGTSQQFEIVGEDFTNLQSTDAITFTATAPTTNIGIINACNAVNEFITYQVDNNPVNYVVSNVYANLFTPVAPGIFINTQQNVPYFALNGDLMTSVGTYTIGNAPQISLNFSTTPGTTTTTTVDYNVTNDLQFVVSQIGPIGGYIDMTINGTYTNSTGTHTLSATIHVFRDN
ncbi:carboxypeptidase-like regulatory domain-containing protein [Flavobacterium terrigena]|uniref:Carboxypeptidase regulatory-like domain-containing protein n=1 Tax=Flavobacterium terrigena TaxID=402734 RepID=A0A1H6QVA1_9FLAO|nr:carboxypeptidase-like regulatory domain-containing protein [Flavobacterium terrigena]SEI47698.1 hypothetical protein SAMN05660918_0831 [Flavobacterium terrigena]